MPANKTLDAEAPIASFLNSILIGGGPGQRHRSALEKNTK